MCVWRGGCPALAPLVQLMGNAVYLYCIIIFHDLKHLFCCKRPPCKSTFCIILYFVRFKKKYLISFKETARIFGFQSCCLFYLAYTTSLVFHSAITTRDFARNSLPVFCWHFYHFRYYFSECLYDICFQCQIFSSFKLLPPLYTWTHKQLAGHVHTCNSGCETFFLF